MLVEEKFVQGYYSVCLGNGAKVEMSASVLAGHHRMTFAANTTASLLVLPSITIEGERGHLNVSLTLDPSGATASGVVVVAESMSNRAASGGLPVYYFMSLRLPAGVTISGVGTWQAQTLTPNQLTSKATKGVSTGCALIIFVVCFFLKKILFYYYKI